MKFQTDLKLTTVLQVDKVHKTTILHTITILGKIIDLEENGNCAKVVIKFGKVPQMFP